jgi:hypothetical protein
MSKEQFRGITRDELDEAIALIRARVAWMDAVGIRQWNVTDYMGVYPRSYFEQIFVGGELFALYDAAGRMLAVGALKQADERWQDAEDADAFYLHHFASAVDCPGAGSRFLACAEQYAKTAGKQYFRLDSAIDNPKLEQYYSKRGYRPVGQCVDGAYVGILREKKL